MSAPHFKGAAHLRRDRDDHTADRLGGRLGLFSDWVEAVDHWIAFGLLAAVGGHMAWHGPGTRDHDEPPPPTRASSGMIVTAVGTSIDAMAVGVSLALLDVDILVRRADHRRAPPS